MHNIIVYLLIMYGSIVVTTKPIKGVPIVGEAKTAPIKREGNKALHNGKMKKNKEVSITKMSSGIIVTTKPIKGVPIVGEAKTAKIEKHNKRAKAHHTEKVRVMPLRKFYIKHKAELREGIIERLGGTKGIDTLYYWDPSADLFYANQPDDYNDSLYNVRFTPINSGTLQGAAFYFYNLVGSGTIRIHVWSSDGTYPQNELGYVDISTDSIISDGSDLTYIDLSSLNISVGSGDFHIGYSLLSGVDTLGLVGDTTPDTEVRSYDMYNGSWEESTWISSGWTWAIDAYVNTSGGGGDSVNLKPYTPTGWYSSLVISNSPDDTTQAPPGNFSTAAGDTQYVHWAVVNEGPDSIPSTDTVYYYLYREDSAIAGWKTGGLAANTYVYASGTNAYPIHESTDGTYTYKITADPNNTISETDETDNSHSESYTWGSGGGGGGGSGAIGPCMFVIITSSDFAPYFQPLADWKNQKGIRTRIISLDTIYAHYTGNDNADKIRNFIKDMHSTYGTMYFLLGGQCDYENGEEIVPRRNAYCMNSGAGYYTDEDTIIADLYFADLDGTWDANGNGTYGETDDNVDMYPDVYVGRAPVKNVSQVQNFVNKVLTYEQAPSQDASYIKSSFHPQGNLWDTNHGTSMPDSMVQFDPSDWTHTFMREDVEGISEQSVNNTFDNGYQLVHFVGHGNEVGVYYNNGTTPMMNNTDADNLSNGFNRLSIITSIACFSGAMDEVSGGDCFAEHLVNAQQGGAVAALFNSRYGWGTSSPEGALGASGEQSKYFFQGIHQQGLYILGQAWAYMESSMVPDAQNSTYYRWCLYERNLLGDPSLEMWTDVPGNLVMSVPVDSIFQGQDTQITVQITNAKWKAAVSNVTVTLLQKAQGDSYDIYLTDTTDAQGNASFSVNAPTTNDIIITATKHNYIYTQDTVKVVPTAGVSDNNKEVKIRFGIRENIVKNNALIQYELPINTKVDIGVYTVDGRLIKHDGFRTYRQSGTYSVDMKGTRRGIYFIEIEAKGYRKIKKVLKTR